MKYNPLEARCVFIDGPVAIYISEAARTEILEAYTRLGRLVAVAAEQLNPGAQECTRRAETDPSLLTSCWSERLGEIRKSEPVFPSKGQVGKS